MTLSFEERKQIWWDWHKENPQVWQYFEKFALEAVGLGRKKVSHWLIINRNHSHNRFRLQNQQRLHCFLCSTLAS